MDDKFGKSWILRGTQNFDLEIGRRQRSFSAALFRRDVSIVCDTCYLK
jgi:hypothetical protein